jgi:predicted nucleic acid-binding protein
MKVLFDTNVLRDALLACEPFVADAAFLLTTVESGQIDGLAEIPYGIGAELGCFPA